MTDSPSPHLLVCLDLTRIDQAVLAFARSARRLFPDAPVRFIHVVQQYDLPDNAPGDQPDRKDPDTRKADLQQALLNRIQPYFPETSSHDLFLPTASEDAASEVIHTAQQTRTDVLFLGEKQDPQRSRWYGKRIAASAPCKVMIVPQTTPLPHPTDSPRQQTVLLASDFSKAADPALQWVLALAQNSRLKVGLHRVRDTSRSFFPFLQGHRAEDSQKATRDAAAQALQRIQYADTSAIAFYTGMDENPHQTEAERILEAATQYKADLLAVSAKGRPGSATTAYGHLVECLGKLTKPCPFFFIPGE